MLKRCIIVYLIYFVLWFFDLSDPAHTCSPDPSSASSFCIVQLSTRSQHCKVLQSGRMYFPWQSANSNYKRVYCCCPKVGNVCQERIWWGQAKHVLIQHSSYAQLIHVTTLLGNSQDWCLCLLHQMLDESEQTEVLSLYLASHYIFGAQTVCV